MQLLEVQTLHSGFVLAVWPWASHLTLLSFHFLTCTIGMLTAAASLIMWTLYRTMPERLLAWSLAHKKSEALNETLY